MVLDVGAEGDVEKEARAKSWPRRRRRRSKLNEAIGLLKATRQQLHSRGHSQRRAPEIILCVGWWRRCDEIESSRPKVSFQTCVFQTTADFHPHFHLLLLEPEQLKTVATSASNTTLHCVVF